jgi:iron(II)-dependent oxidoreductase
MTTQHTRPADEPAGSAPRAGVPGQAGPGRSRVDAGRPDGTGPGGPARSGEALRELAAAELIAARERTTLLTTAVDEADLVKQHSPLMSPLVWDLAHIANQEELWLLRAVGGRDPIHPEIDPLYDAFEHPRAERPTLPLLAPGEARAYGHEVRGRVLDLLGRLRFADPAGETDRAEGAGPPAAFGAALAGAGSAFAFGMVAQHEAQHVETMLATHQLRSGPAVLAAPLPPPPPDAARLPAEVLVPGGPFTMGTSAEPWALDNERPAHQVDVPAFWLDVTPVTNAAYAAFIADGGYDDRRLWTAAGWAHRQRAGLTAPLFWNWRGTWVRDSFGVEEAVVPDEPVMHVCWYEADAYARWAGRRLPTEAEWEKAARWDPAAGRSRRDPWGDEEWSAGRANLGQRHLRPAPAGSYPDGAAPCGARQLVGDVWEWTSSDFLPYPGFTAWPYKEYSEVFFGPEYKVLRGGAFGVSPVACRSTFRNWDYPVRRQIFAGFRTARTAGPAPEPA